MMTHQPTEEQYRPIKVRFIWLRERETVEVQSVKEAIETVKDGTERPPSCVKIILDKEIVYNSERNGDIETWEKEWERAKRRLSVSESARDCPHGNLGCVTEDLCTECQLDMARDGGTAL